MFDHFLRMRIKSRLEELGIKLDAASHLLGFDDRRTLSAVKSCARRVSADELLCFVEDLDAQLEYFMVPIRLVGDGSFSWNLTSVPRQAL